MRQAQAVIVCKIIDFLAFLEIPRGFQRSLEISENLEESIHICNEAGPGWDSLYLFCFFRNSKGFSMILQNLESIEFIEI